MCICSNSAVGKAEHFERTSSPYVLSQSLSSWNCYFVYYFKRSSLSMSFREFSKRDSKQNWTLKIVVFFFFFFFFFFFLALKGNKKRKRNGITLYIFHVLTYILCILLLKTKVHKDKKKQEQNKKKKKKKKKRKKKKEKCHIWIRTHRITLFELRNLPQS